MTGSGHARAQLICGATVNNEWWLSTCGLIAPPSLSEDNNHIEFEVPNGWYVKLAPDFRDNIVRCPQHNHLDLKAKGYIRIDP